MPIDPLARIWPYGVNRGEIIAVERTYNTDVFRSRSGKEKRRILRDKPRKKIKFSTKASKACRRAIIREFYGNQEKTFGLADWTRFVVSTSTMLAGGDRIDVEAVKEWAAIGESVILSAAGRVEVRTINDILGLTLVFDEINGPDAWPIGTRIFAALQGHFNPRLSGQQPIRDVIAINTDFSVDPTTEFYVEPGAAPMQFNGREVHLIGRARVSPATHELFSNLEMADQNIGPITYFRAANYAGELFNITYAGCDEDRVKLLEDVFTRARGQAGELYLPSFENDLVPNVAAGAGTATLDVIGEDVEANYNGSTVFKCVCVRFSDNTFEFNIVDSMTAAAGVTTITFQNNWVKAVDPLTIRGVSWMPVVRFSSDSLTTEWTIKRIGRIKMSFTTLEDLPGD